MQKRVKPRFQANPILKAAIAERFTRLEEIPVYAGVMAMQDRDKQVLWTVEAKYGYDYWTVESSKFPGIRISAKQYMDEVFYECSEVDSIECINVSLQTYNLFTWDYKKPGSQLKESGDIVFGRLPKLAGPNGKRQTKNEQGPALSIAKGQEQVIEEVV